MTIRIGVIGTGVMGAGHASMLASQIAGCEVVAVADADEARAKLVAGKVGATRVFSDGKALIGDTGVDAVVVASPDPTHHPLVMECLRQVKPVLCEKPLGTNSTECREIVETELRSGRRLVQVGFMRRYDAGYVALKEAVKTHTGAPIMVHAAHRNPTVPEAYITPMAIHDTLIHEIDVFRWLLDDDYVSARVIFPRKAARSHGRLRDPQIVVLETAKGVVIDVEIFVNCHYGYDIQCEVVGEDGIARLPEPMAIQMRLGAKLQNAILTDWKDRFIDSYDVELQDFIRATARGTASGPAAWDGYVAAITSDACVAAQEQPGRIVPITLPARPALYD